MPKVYVVMQKPSEELLGMEEEIAISVFDNVLAAYQHIIGLIDKYDGVYEMDEDESEDFDWHYTNIQNEKELYPKEYNVSLYHVTDMSRLAFDLQVSELDLNVGYECP